MSTRTIVLSVLSVAVLIGVGTTIVELSAPDEIRFSPAVGEQRDYRIDVSAVMREDDSQSSSSDTQAVTVQSVMRYRVDSARPSLTVHLDPRFIRAREGRQTFFSSARSGGLFRGPVRDLITGGFDLTMEPDGETRLTATNHAAWNLITKQLTGTLGRQLEQHMLAPSVPLSLPAREGAQVTLDGFQGMPGLRLTVADIDEDSVFVDITRAEDGSTRVDPLRIMGHNLFIQFTNVSGRMRLERDSGWIQSLTLISDQRIDGFGTALNVHTQLAMNADDDPTTGAWADSLEWFTWTSGLAGVSDGYSLFLPQTDGEATDLPLIEPAEAPLADAGTTFRIDGKDNALALTIDHGINGNGKLGQLTLQELTLRDADGQALTIPLVLESIGIDYGDDDRQNTVIRLLPLGWADPGLERIASVDATVIYRPAEEPTHTQLPLADEPTEIRDGSVSARAVPVDGQPGHWRILFAGKDNRYYTYDRTRNYAGLSGRLIDQAVDGGLSASDRTLMQRVDEPDRWFQQYAVEGDGDTFGLALFTESTESSRHILHFTSRALRFSNRDMPPPETRYLDRSTTPGKAPLNLDDLAVRDADRNQLRLTLPRGIGSACELTASAPPLEGHELVWQPAFQRHPDFISETWTPDGETTDWLLMTDDGVRVFFYGIEVDTRLSCPGQPAWHTEPAPTPPDRPWLVDIAAAVDDDVDPETPAALFFRGTRFLDASGRPLRPMPLDASPDAPSTPWSREQMQTTLADYLADDGTIRFWGKVTAVETITFSGEPIERTWHKRLEGLQE
ncbi:hypothetical protein NYO91_00800 [Arhodomonas aquaeolei]|uniref:hypothetical protein n=1 Tax=Arhodomonas aquaeolei TaxID=2369 RepID=UPI002167E478|nr:hypothetical protein [Arhodomonas aquaeolei]MCS4502606.1 hypothetical protein [Arhodomonas aquaeolei]